jgi:hypothetical protein
MNNFSKVEQNILRNKISQIVNGDYIDLDEYHVKYYFSKKLEEILPAIPKEEIYNAIQYANNALKPPRRKKEFIEILISKLRLEC